MLLKGNIVKKCTYNVVILKASRAIFAIRLVVLDKVINWNPYSFQARSKICIHSEQSSCHSQVQKYPTGCSITFPNKLIIINYLTFKGKMDFNLREKPMSILIEFISWFIIEIHMYVNIISLILVFSANTPSFHVFFKFQFSFHQYHPTKPVDHWRL